MPEQRKTSDIQVRVTEVAETLVWCKVNCLTFTDPDSFITHGCRHCVPLPRGPNQQQEMFYSGRCLTEAAYRPRNEGHIAGSDVILVEISKSPVQHTTAAPPQTRHDKEC